VAIYAAAVVDIEVRTVPVYRALPEAAADRCRLRRVADGDPDPAGGQDAATRGRSPRERKAVPALSDDQVAAIVCNMNATEYRALLVDERG
jgi:hypothetical protein